MRRHVAALALLVVAAVGVSGCNRPPQSPQATAPATTSHNPTPATAQTVLPFAGLENPQDVAVDADGNGYIADLHQFTDDKGFPDATTRVIKLAAGSDTQIVLPQFAHAGLVVDAAGAVWVVDAGNAKLVKLAAGSHTQTELPLPNLGMRGDVLAMDAAGNAYGVDGGGVDPGGGCCLPVHVVKSAGADAPTVLPFTYIDGLGGIAVDIPGNIYAGDINRDRVLKLATGSDTPTVMPFDHLAGVADVAADSAGSVYVVDANHNRVLKLTVGSSTPTVLPFNGIDNPTRVTVDTARNVYVIDGGNHRVVKLAASQ